MTKPEQNQGVILNYTPAAEDNCWFWHWRHAVRFGVPTVSASSSLCSTPTLFPSTALLIKERLSGEVSFCSLTSWFRKKSHIHKTSAACKSVYVLSSTLFRVLSASPFLFFFWSEPEAEIYGMYKKFASIANKINHTFRTTHMPANKTD